MVIRERTYTAQEFLELARATENEQRRLELEDGIIVEMPPSRPINSIIASRMAMFLNSYVLERDLGYVTTSDGGYVLKNDRVRQPDAAFISKERYPSVPDEFIGGPDIAVEVVSTNEDVLKKATEYLESGTTLVWAIYPDDKRVHILQASEPRWRELTVNDVLTAEPVFTDFSLPVKDIFPE